MMMNPSLRKFALALHVGVSVGWIGAVAAYTVLDIKVASKEDPAELRAAYIGMELITHFAILPLAIATLVTGLIMSLGTKWGLFRHYWTLISLILTIFALIILLIETQTIQHNALVARDPTTTDDTLVGQGSTLVHSIGGLVVLLTIMWLNMYKPRGVTKYGWRKQQEELAAAIEPTPL